MHVYCEELHYTGALGAFACTTGTKPGRTENVASYSLFLQNDKTGGGLGMGLAPVSL